MKHTWLTIALLILVLVAIAGGTISGWKEYQSLLSGNAETRSDSAQSLVVANAISIAVLLLFFFYLITLRDGVRTMLHISMAASVGKNVFRLTVLLVSGVPLSQSAVPFAAISLIQGGIWFLSWRHMKKRGIE